MYLTAKEIGDYFAKCREEYEAHKAGVEVKAGPNFLTLSGWRYSP